jgi:hypothetical protein
MSTSGQRQTLLWIFFGVLVGGLLVAQLLRAPEYHWRQSYRPEDEDPYGTYLLYELLQESYSADAFHELSGPWPADTLASMGKGDMLVFVGERFYGDTSFRSALEGFLARGGTAWLTAYTFDGLETAYGYPQPGRGPRRDSVALVWHAGEAAPEPPRLEALVYRREDTVLSGSWRAFSQASVQEPVGELEARVWQPLSYYPDTPEAIVALESQWPKDGALLLHCVPLAFGNYHLRREGGLAYLNALLGRYAPERIWWDEGHRVNWVGEGSPEDLTLGPGPLDFILGQPALRWAWYLFLLGVLLLLGLAARRRERPVPPPRQLHRQTEQYIATVARLLRRQIGPEAAGQKRLQRLHEDIEQQLGLRVDLKREPAPAALVAKAQVARETLVYIHNRYNALLEAPGTEALLELDSAIDAFYYESQLWKPGAKEPTEPGLGSAQWITVERSSGGRS